MMRNLFRKPVSSSTCVTLDVDMHVDTQDKLGTTCSGLASDAAVTLPSSRRTILTALAVITVSPCVVLTGCGQKGPLFIEGEGEDTDTERKKKTST